MILFFNKKSDKRWDFLHLSLKNSFNNIKNDMGFIKSHINSKNSQFESKLTEMERRIYRIESMIHMLGQTQQSQTKIIETTKDEEIKFKDDVSDFTNLQKSILVTLFILTKEADTLWLGMKELAQEIYPNKEYSSIRSMISTYTDYLHDSGFIKKRRKGRDTYLSLTEKGLIFMDREKILETRN
ncbi:hypothetical protein J4468_03410 [Candidatus Woesearchaeota archaeon]|nr:hypothetical protein [Candidatus Woesearchaeota archaeon]